MTGIARESGSSFGVCHEHHRARGAHPAPRTALGDSIGRLAVSTVVVSVDD